jgi:hypothetical protein
MSYLFIWIYSGEGERAFHETLQGGRKVEKFGNLWAK